MLDLIKGSLASRTMWFGFIVMLITFLTNNTDAFVGMVNEEYKPLMGYVIAILIWFFRFLTVQPLSEK